ncbi:glycosyltransferase BC10-like [Bidens hawaiensis]|uniref:glycosyltransferase BC10-like n=1 Tax=Bidens hawaiensis TaxID=980011 RepID=UPI00404A26CE
MNSSPWLPTLTLLILSLPMILFFTSHLIPSPPPVSLPEELDDLTLLRRAAAVESDPTRLPKSRLGSTNSKPKIAFLFLTNTHLHFAPLWERFFNPNYPNPTRNSTRIRTRIQTQIRNHTRNKTRSPIRNLTRIRTRSRNPNYKNLYNVYVHADPTVKPYIKPPGGVFAKTRFIPAKETHRGTASLIATARRLIATAILDDPENQFFALVSQHCIPLHSFRFVYNTLFEVDSHQLAELRMLEYKSFIEIIDKDDNLWDRYTARGDNVMVPEVKFESFRVGSQFFTLTRRHALMVVKERRLWNKFRLPCLRPQSCYPEEHYFPTLLAGEDPNGCAGYTLTRVNWTDSVSGHPHTYYPNELSPELIYNLRKSSFAQPYMFARKFSPDCLKPLMDMADSVIFRD